MMKQMIMIGLMVILASTQTTVTPKTQACACANLLSQPDCTAKAGCSWTFATTTNSTTNTTTTSTTQGTCANSTTTVILMPPSYCLNVTNVSLCAQTIGCAFLNNTCQIFTGCSAYLQTTNAACQAISTQCTTDGIRCVSPTACQTYTTQALCSGNLATSGAKSCTWTASGSAGTCADKVCSDAPVTYTTQSQCTGWIAGCLATGKGCATSLGACSSYTQANGCTGMIGSDGPCTTNTAVGSTVCRPLVCSDAANTLATNTACSQFLTGCVTIGKGCTSSLQTCSSYTQTQGCTGLIGTDGPCSVNTTTGSTACRALACADAPVSTSTNAACALFLAGCVTTGQGCTNSLGLCSSYTGTTSTCSSFIGTDGNCKGTSATAASCAARTCADAPTTTNTNAACAAYQTGCITNGFGCVTALGLCTSYTGTNTTCAQYIGSDGNCTAPPIQTSSGACAVKVCSEAPSSTSTNAACQAYSYTCVTNGNGCVTPTTCEATPLAITCQGQPSCVSNQICLNRSQCANYLNQSQCLLNQQQYSSGGTVYLRACSWSSGTCQNQVCSSLSTSFSTDSACTTALAGCLTKGQGCVDINDGCGSYAGLTAACLGFKGVNGTQLCTQLNSVTNPSTACVARTLCSEAKTNSLASVTQSSNTTCSAYLPGCFFDGKDNCTKTDCTTYFGTQTQCAAITTALDGTNPQTCWKTSDIANTATACVVKLCTHATGTSYLTNSQCNQFLTGCVWNGTAAGGCVSPNTACNSYSGSLTTCVTFQESNKVCTKTAGFCKALVCTTKIPPSTANTAILKGSFCQGFTDQSGNTCQMGSGASCVAPGALTCTSFVAVGADNAAKSRYCQSLNYPGDDQCGYTTGDNCDTAACTQFTPSGATDDLKAASCQNLVIDGTIKCGLATSTSTQCSARSCSDYGVTTIICQTGQYLSACAVNTLASTCYTRSICSNYTIPASFSTTDLLKAKFCNKVVPLTSPRYCTYVNSLSTTTCSTAPAECTEVGISASMTDNQDKVVFCLNSLISSSLTCAYSSDTSSTCIAVAATCDLYVPYQGAAPDNIVSQTFCQTLFDQSYKFCAFTAGTPNCVVAQSTCAAYNTYGTTIAQNQAFCSQLTKSGNSDRCASNTAGPSICKDPQCSDVTTGCSAYNGSCAFDGVACVALNPECSGYTAQSAGQGQQANCAFLTTASYQSCGWDSGPNCASFSCSQLTGAFANVQICQNRNCTYNGLSCVARASSCTSYTPAGSTDAIKAANCSVMVILGFDKCTYMVGTNTCIDRAASCAYNKPASATDAQAQAACQLALDPDGKQCGYTAGNAQCSPKSCLQPFTASLDSDCSSYLIGCDLDTASSCAPTICTNAPKNLTTNAACASFRSGCITNGGGCVEATAACSDLKGTQTLCNGYNGNSVPCTNTSTAGATDACINKTCILNTTAKSDLDCAVWLPPTAGVASCVWGGSSGCVSPQLCTQFTGTIDSCPTFTATDGPCYGTGTVASPAPCAANTSNCTAAPATFNTDAQCKKWGSTCMTNGFGCISTIGATCSSILSQFVCPLYKSTTGLFCDLAIQCKTKPSTCAGFTASECNNTPLAGSTQITCAWNAATTTCVSLTCALLPVTLITDGACSTIISTCTTNGAGCITKGACSSYPKQACGPAATTDTQKACIWSNSVCRPVQCTDNTTAISDAACNTYLAGCRTTGAGCVATLTCSVLTSATLCLFDSTNYPCLWYKASATAVGTCINYAQCTDIIQSTHTACQSASPLCTTNGTNCIAITGCSKTILQASCIIGTDGNCGWFPASGSTSAACALFTNCSAATGTTTAQCQAWGSACISNGTTCLSKSTCSTYTTQIACGNAGTDGTCFWVPPTGTATTGTCRLQLCSDAASNLSTHTGCIAFPAQTTCTTSGTACIPQAICSSYSIQAGCVQGTDGVCFWSTTTSTTSTSTSVCRLKLCTDSLLTSSASCATAITGVKCVSNGVNCIPQSTCSTYTAREACLGGGSDGACAFTPGTNSSTPNLGTCAQFSQCSIANSDQTACNIRLDACYFNSTTTNGTTTSSCSSHTCATKALGSSCQPVPSWDLSTYQICILTGTTCAAGNPTSFTASSCYSNSVGTYSWSANTSSCTACISSTTPNTTNTTVNNTNNTYGQIISIILAIALII